MVAVIKTSGSLRNALHYNEQKVTENKAELIHAHGFMKDIDKLGFTDKIRRFEKLTELNDNIRVNSVHISLNFDLSEKLSKEKLRQIADSYMQKIGFGDQPYLVYQHNDSGHVHIHVVTTNIRKDGSRIKLHNIGRNESEKARKEIEKEFDLVLAQGKQQNEEPTLKPVNTPKVQYGRSETKRAMSDVLDHVLTQYRYCSLPELNAILKQYNMVADPGSPDSRTFKNGGLVYRVLNEKGEKIGVPIKASDFYNKPTMGYLKELFKKNESLKEPHKLRVKDAVDVALAKKAGMSLQELEEALKKDNIQLVTRKNEKGEVCEVTYVDHNSKCVFSESDIGKWYSADQLKIQTSRHSEEQLQKNQSQETTRDPAVSIPNEQKLPKNKLPAEDLPQVDIDLKEILKDMPSVSSGSSIHLPLDFLKPQEQGSLNAELNKEQKKKRKKKLRQ